MKTKPNVKGFYKDMINKIKEQEKTVQETVEKTEEETEIEL